MALIFKCEYINILTYLYKMMNQNILVNHMEYFPVCEISWGSTHFWFLFFH